MTSIIFKNKKIKSKKKYGTFSDSKDYFKNNLFEEIKTIPKKRKKIKMEDFEILSYSEYDKLIKNNYNVSQLKQMLKFYKQKVSGNKKELLFLLYNYLKYSGYALKIQRNFRGHIVRYLKKLKGQNNKNKCINETDFYTLEKINNFDNNQFYSFKDKDGFIYGFDICSLYNMIVKEKQMKNPYNRNILPVDKIYKDIKNILKISNILNIKINIVLDNDISLLSKTKQIEMYTISLFQKIDELGFITDSKWYLNLNRQQLKGFLNELYDIWQYRAQIPTEIRRKINPQYGNPFFNININVLMHKCYEVLRKRILDIIEIFITKGIDQDARALGTYYVLGALTTVSHDAAISLPWLYESFVQT